MKERGMNMNNYTLVMIGSPQSFILHTCELSNYQNLVNKYRHREVTILLQDTKQRCSFLLNTLLKSETVIYNTLTNIHYKCDLKKAMEITLKANITDVLIKIVKVDLTEFTAVWSRLTAHFVEFSKNNELTSHAEVGRYIVYPVEQRSGRVVIQTDNPETTDDIVVTRTLTSDGTVLDTRVLNDISDAVWDVQYDIADFSTLIIKTETIDVNKLKHPVQKDRAKTYIYELTTPLKDAIFCVISQNFNPKWI